jgi:hypothetical protein
MEQSRSWEANRSSASQKFPYYGTRRFITALSNMRRLSLSWARSTQSVPPPMPMKVISGENPLCDDWIHGFRFISNSLRLESWRFLISVQDIRTWFDNTEGILIGSEERVLCADDVCVCVCVMYVCMYVCMYFFIYGLLLVPLQL